MREPIEKAHDFSRSHAYARLYIAQKGKCAGCRTFFPKLTIDHVIPVSRGGADTPANWQLLCRSCNSRKRTSITAGSQQTIWDAPKPERSDRAAWREYHRVRKARQRAIIEAQGICVICCSRQARPARKACQECADQYSVAQRRRRAAVKAMLADPATK